MIHRQFAALISLFCLIAPIGQAKAIPFGEPIGEQPEEQIDKNYFQDNSNGHAYIHKSNIPQKINSNLSIRVASDVYSDRDRQVLYCPQGNYLVVRNRIYLLGSDLDKVKQVKYILHDSFYKQTVISDDPAYNFEIWIWTWGSFPLKAIVTTETGQSIELDYPFSFKSKFEDAVSKGVPQIIKCVA